MNRLLIEEFNGSNWQQVGNDYNNITPCMVQFDNLLNNLIMGNFLRIHLIINNISYVKTVKHENNNMIDVNNTLEILFNDYISAKNSVNGKSDSKKNHRATLNNAFRNLINDKL